MDIKTKLIIYDIKKSMAKRGLETQGRVQQFIDSEVLRLCDPYVPMDTGQLKQSGTRHTRIGSGRVVYKTPYARRMYYNPQYNFQGAPMRGAYWFERFKANHRDEILKGAAKVAGARGEKK